MDLGLFQEKLYGGGGGGGGGGTELFFRGTTHLTLIFLWVPPLKLKFQ